MDSTDWEEYKEGLREDPERTQRVVFEIERTTELFDELLALQLATHEALEVGDSVGAMEGVHVMTEKIQSMTPMEVAQLAITVLNECAHQIHARIAPEDSLAGVRAKVAAGGADILVSNHFQGKYKDANFWKK